MFRDPPAAPAAPGLPPLQASVEAIQLEIVYVVRPRGDPLLGAALWRDVDQILTFSPELQRNLNANGFQIGVVSHPPPELNEMLGLRSAAAADPAGGAAGAPMLSGKRVFVVDGGETEVVVSDVYPKCGMIVADAGAAPAQEREYDAARCLFRVRVQRDQEGWARLEFTPVVQYGQELLRPVARDSEWEMVAQRREDRFYPQRFEVLLNIGDMCLITGRTDRHGTPGYRFFLGPDGHDDLQRLFLVRLVHIGRAAAAK